MARRIALIGFGEAAKAFVGAPGWTGPIRAYDKLTDQPERRSAKIADYALYEVLGSATIEKALEGSDLVLSLVTASEALPAARRAARFIESGAIYCDMNSVSPDTKRAAAQAIESGGGRYVDVAIMSPVNPAGLAVPLLVSGPASAGAEHGLREVGFQNLRSIGPRVGTASATKMIRSVLVKGIEALTAEAMMAALEGGVVDEVLSSLDSSERAVSWPERADYNLDRMLVHGARRGEEMEEAVRTLQSLGVEPILTRATARIQREIGALGVDPGRSLEAKIAQLRPKADAA